jgi:NitT/TauT family transport system substrate-binding protein
MNHFAQSSGTKAYGFLFWVLTYVIVAMPHLELKAEENIIIGMPTFNFASLPFHVAAENGFYKKNGLTVQHVLMRSDIATAALSSGNVQYNSHFNSLIRATVNGFDMRVLFSTSKQMFSLVVQPEIRSVMDLRGKIIGTYAFGALQYAITSRVLRAAGINPEKDVTWMVGNDAVFRHQLKAKKMHAALINPPLSVMLEKEGLKLLLHASDYVDVPMVGLGATRTKIRENPEQVKRGIKVPIRGS